MKRRDAIERIMENITDELVICNIGFPSRELYDINDRDENFYMIGSMGLVSSIALGLSISKPDKKVVIIDGDGAFLMNLSSIATIFSQNPKNLTWIVINNQAYGSTGNQETCAKNLNLKEIAKGVGFKNSYDMEEIANLKEVLNKNELTFINYNVKPGNSKAPIIPLSPVEIRDRFLSIL